MSIEKIANRARFKQYPKSSRYQWIPKVGQTYYFVDIGGHIDSFTFERHAYDDRKGNRGKSVCVNMLEHGNCFRTEQQARAASKIIKGVFHQIHNDWANFPEFKNVRGMK